MDDAVKVFITSAQHAQKLLAEEEAKQIKASI